MKRRTVVGLAVIVTSVALAELWIGLEGAPRRTIGIVGALLLVLTVTGLSIALFRERERLISTRHALARSEVRAQALVEASPDGVVLLDGTRIVFANPAFRSLLSLPPDGELVGQDLLALVAPEERERVEAWLATRLSGSEPSAEVDITAVRLSGAEVALEAASALLPARTGRQLALFLRDTTARHGLETRLRHLERLETLADLGEGLIRDLDRMFLGIRRLARGADDEGEERSRQATLELIERLASRGAAMTRRVRSLVPSAVDRSTHRKIEVVKLVRDVAADFLRSMGSDVTLRVIPEPGQRMVVLGDAPQIRQAIWQLLQNAREAQAAGEIQVRTRRLRLEESDAGRIPGSRPGEYALIEIEDSGPGIDPGLRTKVFEPFFSTKGGRASGLGLTIAYGAARAHGGFSDLESDPRKGTAVRLAFPLLPADAAPDLVEEKETDPKLRWRGRETILMVDDDHGPRAEAARLLEPYGYHVELAASPREALQRLRHRPKVDIVLLDMVLPGWNGPDVLERVLRNWPGQRVLMVSPYPLREQEDQAMKLGAVGVLRKPLRDPELARAVRSALDRPPPAAA